MAESRTIKSSIFRNDFSFVPPVLLSSIGLVGAKEIVLRIKMLIFDKLLMTYLGMLFIHDFSFIKASLSEHLALMNLF